MAKRDSHAAFDTMRPGARSVDVNRTQLDVMHAGGLMSDISSQPVDNWIHESRPSLNGAQQGRTLGGANPHTSAPV